MTAEAKTASPGKHIGLKIVGGVVALVVVVAGIFMVIGKPESAAPNTAIDKAPSHQESRNTVINKLVEDGFFAKVDLTGPSPRVTIGPAFTALDLGTQTKLVRVVYAYQFDGSKQDDTVLLVDAAGAEAGSYSLATGLQLKPAL